MAFSAEVLSMGQGGGNAVVVPKDIAQTFGSKRPPVLAHVNGVEYRSRLAVYGGRSYLGLRKDLLRQLGVAVGDQVEPPELTQALADNPAAKAAYEQLSFTHRNEYARWIDEAKKPETRVDRVAKTIKRLTERR